MERKVASGSCGGNYFQEANRYLQAMLFAYLAIEVFPSDTWTFFARTDAFFDHLLFFN